MEKVEAFGTFAVGEDGVGEAPADAGSLRFGLLPPHSDIKERTEKERTERNISEWSSGRAGGEGGTRQTEQKGKWACFGG